MQAIRLLVAVLLVRMLLELLEREMPKLLPVPMLLVRMLLELEKIPIPAKVLVVPMLSMRVLLLELEMSWMPSPLVLVTVLLARVLLLELEMSWMPLLPLPVAFAKLLRIWLLSVPEKEMACALVTVEFPCKILQF